MKRPAEHARSESRQGGPTIAASGVRRLGARFRGIGILFLAARLVGCGSPPPDAYRRAFAEAERTQSAGRYLDAVRAYEAAAAMAKTPRDRAHANYAAAQACERAKRWQEAVSRYDVLSRTSTAEHAVESAYRSSLLRIAHGESEEGWRRLDVLVQEHPDHGVSRPALARILGHLDDTRGTSAALRYLEGLSPALDGSELGETIAYERAVRLAESGEKEAAREAFVRVAERWPYPFGALFDDALFRASEIDEALGQPERAIHDLERMLAEREVSHFSGSYQRPRFSPALMRIAALYRDRLGDRQRARDAFHRLYAEHTTSPLRDDALWQEALLWREEGDTAMACKRLATLVDEFPDSRFVPCAPAGCPRISRPAKSRGPTECHDYIEREAAPGDAKSLKE